MERKKGNKIQEQRIEMNGKVERNGEERKGRRGNDAQIRAGLLVTYFPRTHFQEDPRRASNSATR